MIQDIKKQLLNNPENIVNILAHYEFQKIEHIRNEIRCARDIDGNKTSIRIKLNNNDSLMVTDFAKNITNDLFGYIMSVRNLTFTDVLSTVKNELYIDNFENYYKPKFAFGGFYSNIKNRTHDADNKTYNVSILDAYENIPNVRFAKDNIPYPVQKIFNIMFDNDTQRITIPIYNPYGELIGVKGRANWDINNDECKYLYLIPCAVSATLYGYHINYSNLVNAEQIFIFEAEKSVMQCYSYGICNCVALGSNSVSSTQCKLLLELNPEKIVFMFDENLEHEVIERNIEKINRYCRMKDVQFGWWEWNKDVITKNSPSDYGKERLFEIIESEIKYEKGIESII